MIIKKSKLKRVATKVTATSLDGKLYIRMLLDWTKKGGNKWVVGTFGLNKEPETFHVEGRLMDCQSYLERYNKKNPK